MTTVRRTFLKNTAALAAATALPALGLAQGAPAQRQFKPQPGAWRTFEVTTRVDILQPEGATRVWLPVPSIDTDWQHSLDSAYASNGQTRMSSERCPNCGMLTERIVSMPHRFDGLVKIKGMLVNPQLLVDAMMGEPDIVEFQAFVDKEDPFDGLSMDRLLIKLVPKANADSNINKRVLDRVRHAISVTPLIEITTSDDPALKNRGWKTKPLIDLRAPAK